MLNYQRVPLVSRSFLLHGSLAENMWIFRRLKRAKRLRIDAHPWSWKLVGKSSAVSCEVNSYGSCETQTASFLSQIPHVWGPWNLHFHTYLIISTSYMLIYIHYICIYNPITYFSTALNMNSSIDAAMRKLGFRLSVGRKSCTWKSSKRGMDKK